jgi:uncharacterized surface protein with fasciclin (FAS1) repeats
MVLNFLTGLVVSTYMVFSPSTPESGDRMDPAMNIVEVAISAGSFNPPVQALTAAGLVETLSPEGPFTVFAPADEAFAEIPAADLEALLADKQALTSVLTYHVVPGRVYAEDVVNLSSAVTANGQALDLTVKDGKVLVDGATVIRTDIEATNGLIHVIDRVIFPK